MTGKEFLNALANGESDTLQGFINVLDQYHVDYCVIDGLGVNAYTEPVVSLDLEIVIAAADRENLCAAVEPHVSIERFPHSINPNSSRSDLRIQLQTDPRYQKFIPKAIIRNVPGYPLKVATLEGILMGKIRAYGDQKGGNEQTAEGSGGYCAPDGGLSPSCRPGSG